MGCNYYLRTGQSTCCSYCGSQIAEQIHIGKSSWGWCFALHVTDEIRSLDDWVEKFNEGEIVDEYGESITAKDMIDIIKRTRWKSPKSYPSATWYVNNHAEPGPRNFARHQLGFNCVGHGEGCWDLIEGDFS